MTDWTHGYIAEIDYTYGFYRELSPALLNYALLLRGFEPPSLDAGFRYCELGFGQGVSANLLAATHPQGHFEGTDFNPRHASGAAGLSAAAGLKNTAWHDDSFEQFLDRDTEPFDYISLHGIWSWVSPQNRHFLVEILRRKLRPGGVAYISYNCTPGWNPMIPLRDLLTRHVQNQSPEGATIGAKIDAALVFAEELRQLEARFFKLNPAAVERLEKLREGNRNYLAHEYFNLDWNPMAFADVASALSAAKLEFAASAHLADHIDVLNFPDPVSKRLDTIKDVGFRETVRDFWLNNQFRRDIFTRGARNLSPTDRLERLIDIPIALHLNRAVVKLEANGGLGLITLRPDVHEPVLDALAQGPLTIRDMLKRPAIATIGVVRIVQAVTILIGQGYLFPASMPAAAKGDLAAATQIRKESSGRFNQAVIAASRYNTQWSHLASPLTGGALTSNRFQLMFLDAIGRGETSPDAWGALAQRQLQAQGVSLVKEGKKMETAEENLAELQRQAREFAERELPVLRAHGVC
jgi:SAM-dependent methyltransferase